MQTQNLTISKIYGNTAFEHRIHLLNPIEISKNIRSVNQIHKDSIVYLTNKWVNKTFFN